MRETKLIKPKEAMEILGVGSNRMYVDLLKRKDFPCFRMGNNYYIDREMLDIWIKKQCEER